MAVLVNQTAPAPAEIVAACLQDNHRAVIVGQRTWGKGTVQEVTDLGDRRGELKLTVASYWRPSGENIHRRHGAGKRNLGRRARQGLRGQGGGGGVGATPALAAAATSIVPRAAERTRRRGLRPRRWSIGSWPMPSPTWRVR